MNRRRLSPRTDKQPLTVSVIVPCAAEHVSKLAGLLVNLRRQTRKPDEVVIAVSGCERSNVPKFNIPNMPGYTFDVVVVHDRNKAWAGANRNRAAAAAQGGLLICQDADDLSHPQRIEITASLFEKYEIDHLMHFFYYLNSESTLFSVADAELRSFYCDDFTQLMKADYRVGVVRHVHNGNCAVLRTLAQTVKWPDLRRGQDVAFSRLVYTRTKKTAVIPLPLLTYRHNLSTKPRT